MFQLDALRRLPSDDHRGRSKMRGLDGHRSGACGKGEFSISIGCGQKISRTTGDLRTCDWISGCIDNHTRDRGWRRRLAENWRSAEDQDQEETSAEPIVHREAVPD